MRQTDTLFTRHVIVGLLPGRLSEADDRSLLDFGVHPRAIEHEIEFGAEDAALVVDQFHARRANFPYILKCARRQYA